MRVYIRERIKGGAGENKLAKKPTRAGCGWFVGWLTIYDIYSAKLTKLLLARGAEKTRRKILRRLGRRLAMSREERRRKGAVDVNLNYSLNADKHPALRKKKAVSVCS